MRVRVLGGVNSKWEREGDEDRWFETMRFGEQHPEVWLTLEPYAVLRFSLAEANRSEKGTLKILLHQHNGWKCQCKQYARCDCEMPVDHLFGVIRTEKDFDKRRHLLVIDPRDDAIVEAWIARGNQAPAPDPMHRIADILQHQIEVGIDLSEVRAQCKEHAIANDVVGGGDDKEPASKKPRTGEKEEEKEEKEEVEEEEKK
jgi:hypothetical protein